MGSFLSQHHLGANSASSTHSLESVSAKSPVANPHDPLAEYVAGYPRLAARMAARPEIAIFHTFAALNARNLLYLQAELSMLEKELQKQTVGDGKKENEKSKRCEGDTEGTETGGEKMENLKLAEKLGKKREEYNKALLQNKHIATMKRPDTFDLRSLQHWLDHPLNASNPLVGVDSNTWGSILDSSSHAADLITPRPRKKEDSFTNWLQEHCVNSFVAKLWQPFVKKSRVTGEKELSDEGISRVTFGFTAFMGSMLPIVNIWLLVWVEGVVGKVVVAAVANLVVAAFLGVCTEATRRDMFLGLCVFSVIQATVLRFTFFGWSMRIVATSH